MTCAKHTGQAPAGRCSSRPAALEKPSFLAIFAATRRLAVKRVTILVHRQELLDQVSRALKLMDVPHGVIAATYEPEAGRAVQVASVMSLVRRLETTPAPDLLIIDECHHAAAGSWDRIIKAWDAARVLGVSATPCRLGGAGLGDTFDRLIIGPSVAELTAAGHLSPARVFAPPTISTEGMHTLAGDYLKSEVSAAVDKPRVTGDAISHYQRLTPGRKAVVFCVSLKHAEHMATAARAAGITAVTVDGTMDRDVRRRIIDDFSRGAIQWLVTVDLVSEGFDVPSIEVGIFLRPTASLGLWLQQAGRCIRSAPGKTEAILLDHAGNTQRFGLPSEDRQWTLEGSTAKRTAKDRPTSVRVCPKCFSAQPGGKPNCAHCGTRFEIDSRRVEHEDGELEEVTSEELAKRAARREVGMAAHHGDRAKLEEIARIRGLQAELGQDSVGIAQQKSAVCQTGSAVSSSESAVLRDILTRLSNSTVRLIRQQSGNFQLADGRRLQVGVPGLSDLVGLRSIVVTPEMVGERIAIFAAIEVKSKRGIVHQNQRDFVTVVADLGGYAGIARSVDDARAILRLK